MKKLLFCGGLLLASSTLIGCGSSVGQSVQQAVVENQSAESLLQWESSGSNPEVLFSKWREEYLHSETERENLQAEICKELATLEPQNLTLFENEINSKENEVLVGKCKGDLQNRLEAYYEKERSRFAVSVNALLPQASRNNFQFQPNVQKRDTENGYFAVTGDVARKEVIITFDDGPSGLYTESILRSLREVNAKAIFFHMGKNVRANPEIVKKVAADGHAIGSHSITHACLGTSRACEKTNGTKLTFDEAVAEVRGGHQAVYDVLGWVDPFFRFPYGEASPELKSFLKSKSTAEFFWSIDSEDWKAQSNENLLRNTLAQIEARGRGIVLFHDIQRKTAEIMPQFLRELYSRGYSIVLLQAADPAARYNSKLVKKTLP